MNSEYVNIPPGLLNTWSGVQPNNVSNDNAMGMFDAQQVAIGTASSDWQSK